MKFSLKTVVVVATIGCVLLSLSRSGDPVYALLVGAMAFGIGMMIALVVWQILIETGMAYRRRPEQASLDDSLYVVGAAVTKPPTAKRSVDGRRLKRSFLIALALFFIVLVTPVFVRLYRFHQQEVVMSIPASAIVMLDEVLLDIVNGDDVVYVILASTAAGAALLVAIVVWQIASETSSRFRLRGVKRTLNDPPFAAAGGATDRQTAKPSLDGLRSNRRTVIVIAMFLIVLASASIRFLGHHLQQQRAEITVSVSGVVTLKGAPLDNADVEFYSFDDEFPTRSVRTGSDGRFRLPLHLGRFKVTLSRWENPHVEYWESIEEALADGGFGPVTLEQRRKQKEYEQKRGRQLIPADMISRETTPLTFKATYYGPNRANIHIE